jgi:predicted nucleotidyltransferase
MILNEKMKNVISNIVSKNRYTLYAIFLFGSRARKDYDAESDYDLLVILKEDIGLEEKRKLTIKIYNQLHKEIKLAQFDIIVKSLNRFEEEKNVVNTISNEAFLEGVKL